MTRLARRAFLAAVGCGCLVAPAAFAQASPSGKYVCPPCGCDQDGKVFDAPGVCPADGCGMTLIPKAADPPKPAAPSQGGAL